MRGSVGGVGKGVQGGSGRQVGELGEHLINGTDADRHSASQERYPPSYT